MYRALSWFIDCPRDSSIDRNIDNARAAGEGLTSALIMPSHPTQALSLFQSILLSLGQSINHDNALYISNYYISNLSPFGTLVMGENSFISPIDPFFSSEVMPLFTIDGSRGIHVIWIHSYILNIEIC